MTLEAIEKIQICKRDIDEFIEDTKTIDAVVKNFKNHWRSSKTHSFNSEKKVRPLFHEKRRSTENINDSSQYNWASDIRS